MHKHFPHIRLDEYVIMPNHVHFILEINYDFKDNKTGYADEPVGTGRKGLIFSDRHSVGNGRDRSLHAPIKPKIKPLYDVTGAFKTTSSKLIHQKGYNNFQWQKSFHDRVIRNEKELYNKRDYIISNSAKWAEDRNNPTFVGRSQLRLAKAN